MVREWVERCCERMECQAGKPWAESIRIREGPVPMR